MYLNVIRIIQDIFIEFIQTDEEIDENKKLEVLKYCLGGDELTL